jgi:hypothetical protein
MEKRESRARLCVSGTHLTLSKFLIIGMTVGAYALSAYIMWLNRVLILH